MNEQRSDWLWYSIIKPLLAVNILNLVASAVGTVVSFRFMNTFELLLMLEGAVLLIAGGTLDIASSMFGTEVQKLLSHSKREYSPDQHRKQQGRAANLILLGLVVVVEALVLSLLLT